MDIRNKQVQDCFICPNPAYRDNNATLMFSTCIRRQLTIGPIIKTPTYEICHTCQHGKAIRAHFKEYVAQPTLKEKRINAVMKLRKLQHRVEMACQPLPKKRRKAKGEDAFSHYYVGGK